MSLFPQFDPYTLVLTRLVTRVNRPPQPMTGESRSKSSSHNLNLRFKLTGLSSTSNWVDELTSKEQCTRSWVGSFGYGVSGTARQPSLSVNSRAAKHQITSRFWDQ